MVLKDETGKKYGKLLVLSRVGSNRNREATWLCKCDCGNKTVVTGHHLRRGSTKSCGCLPGGFLSLPEGESAFTTLYYRIRSGARTRGYIWELTKEQVRTLTSQNCYYCGVPASQIAGYWGSEYTYNGIDRQDNDLGYTKSNCVPCCKWCNLAKSTRSTEDFIAWATRIADKQRI